MRVDKTLIKRVDCGESPVHRIINCSRCLWRLASFCLACALLAPHAFAQPWQRLSDGRVVIEVKDHKLAFDPNIWGASGTSATVNFLTDHESERHSLADVLAQPDGFRAAFASSPSVLVRMTNSANGPGLFLNRFDRRSVPDSTRIEIYLFTDSDKPEGCYYSFRRITARLASCTENNLGAFETVVPDEDGFFRVVSPSDYARAQHAEYVLAPDLRKAYAPAPLIVSCSTSLNNSRPREWGQCSASSWYGNDIGIYYQFDYSRFPKSRWIELDRRMRDIYADILMQNEGGQK